MLSNNSGNVLYSGETDVNVTSGVTANVNLTLMPTETSVGQIFISVTWGTQNVWIDNPQNPILSTTNSYWDIYGPNQSKIINDNGVFRMWFGNIVNSGVSYVGYAYSYDGTNWIRPTSEPVLSPGPAESWDAGRAGVGPVIKENGLFKMYYNGWKNQDGLWQVGMAVSQME